MTTDPLRLVLVLIASLAYALLCCAAWLRQRRRAAAQHGVALAQAQGPAWLVAYASQTGNAEELALQTATTLRLAGIPVRLCELAQLRRDDLQSVERILFLVSTYGEGDAPDNAAAFASTLMTLRLPLAHLHYCVLALGDSSYQHYCGFGRALDGWLAQQGAAALFERIEVNRSSAPDILRWMQQLSHLAGTVDAPDWSAPAFADWRLLERRRLNPGSAGAALFHIELEPVQGDLPHWQSGDLVQIVSPEDLARPREYSIASIPGDGRVHLLIRLHAHADGTPGLVSGWLAQQAPLGAEILLRLRAHRRFRLEENAQSPLILIGNGSGIAGLRAHLKTRAQQGLRRNWLIFGERNREHDEHYRDEIAEWQASGILPRLDQVYSRDQSQRLYVQDRLLGNADEIVLWIKQGAALYVCGSLSGMAQGVDQALEQILGRAGLDGLAAQGRYRRDVY